MDDKETAQRVDVARGKCSINVISSMAVVLVTVQAILTACGETEGYNPYSPARIIVTVTPQPIQASMPTQTPQQLVITPERSPMNTPLITPVGSGVIVLPTGTATPLPTTNPPITQPGGTATPTHITRSPAATSTSTSIPAIQITNTSVPTYPEPLPAYQIPPDAKNFVAPSDERFEHEFPPTMELGQSTTIRFSFIAEQPFTSIPEVFGNTVESVPAPVVGTPGPLSRAQGTDYDAFISAQLDGGAFKIDPENNREYLLSGRKHVEWIWTVLPERGGLQVLNVTVEVRWKPRAAGETITSPIHRRRLETNVDVPFMQFSSPIEVTPLITGVIGALIAWLGPKLYSLLLARWAGKQQPSSTEPQLSSVESHLACPHCGAALSSIFHLTQARKRGFCARCKQGVP